MKKHCSVKKAVESRQNFFCKLDLHRKWDFASIDYFTFSDPAIGHSTHEPPPLLKPVEQFYITQFCDVADKTPLGLL